MYVYLCVVSFGVRLCKYTCVSSVWALLVACEGMCWDKRFLRKFLHGAAAGFQPYLCTEESAQISCRSLQPPSCPASLQVRMPRQWTFVLFKPGSGPLGKGSVVSHIRAPISPLEIHPLSLCSQHCRLDQCSFVEKAMPPRLVLVAT